MGVVPATAEPEPNAVAEVIRCAEHFSWSNYDVFIEARMSQVERVDIVRQFDPQDETALRISYASSFRKMQSDQAARFIDPGCDRGSQLAVTSFDAGLHQ